MKDWNKITKLAVIDFDGTLMDTPLPEEGKIKYEKKMGVKWPYKGWWSKKESLDDTIFNIQPVESVIADYKANIHDNNTAVIMLTGRLKKLEPQVKKLLDKYNLIFDGYYYNTGGSTDKEKINTMDILLQKYPNIKEIEMWDDRMEHIPIFEQWGKNQCLMGKLENFNINVVISKHHQ